LTSAEWTSCSACHELLCSRAFLFIALRSAQHPQIPRLLQFFEEFGQCPSPSCIIPHLLCLRNARAFPLLPAALASVLFWFVLVRVRVEGNCGIRKAIADGEFGAWCKRLQPGCTLKSLHSRILARPYKNISNI